jgi:superoxide dismutase, Cu-Zn family
MSNGIRCSRFGPPGAILAIGLALMLAIMTLPAATAQESATPAAIDPEGSSVVIMSPDEDGVEQPIGTATFTQGDGEVTIYVEVEGLEPGDRGIHIHEIGICDPDADEPYSTAGDHFNPTDEAHGPGPDEANDVEAHAGDLGNITIDEDGTGTLEVTSDRISLVAGAENSLADADGSALLIHENPDDLETDPSGESGAPIACGVIFASLQATPVVDATPVD